ncbi:hypothetical protein [Methanofollis sp. UBA420]|jgi:hypothetical protein|uniref:hypothetical protein n=1 Tax=Methanofollis sp. UBA420 TaxID=1915514 RepID=UPI00316ABE9E
MYPMPCPMKKAAKYRANIYAPRSQSTIMKKQGEQKTKGHKATEGPGAPSPAKSKAEETLSKEKIDSLKDKYAAKMKKGKKH